MWLLSKFLNDLKAMTTLSENSTVYRLFLSLKFPFVFATLHFPTFVSWLLLKKNYAANKNNSMAGRTSFVMFSLSVMYKGGRGSLNISTPTKEKIGPKITPERNYWSFLHSKSHYVLSCFPFFETFRRKKKGLFQSMNRSLCEYKLPEVPASLPKKNLQ